MGYGLAKRNLCFRQVNQPKNQFSVLMHTLHKKNAFWIEINNLLQNNSRLSIVTFIKKYVHNQYLGHTKLIDHQYRVWFCIFLFWAHKGTQEMNFHNLNWLKNTIRFVNIIIYSCLEQFILHNYKIAKLKQIDDLSMWACIYQLYWLNIQSSVNLWVRAFIITETYFRIIRLHNYEN